MLKSYCSMAALLVASLTISSNVSAAPMFNPANGHMYDVVSSGANGSWDNAEASAIALGGHLVTLNDAAEESWLRGAFGLSTTFWIGYNDAAIEGAFAWSSGETPGYTNWNASEPNNMGSTGEDYVVLNWNSITGGWNDWGHDRPGYIYTSGIAEYAVPEPAMLGIFGLGLAGLGVMRRRRVSSTRQTRR